VHDDAVGAPPPKFLRWYMKAADVLATVQANLAALCLAAFICLIFTDVFYRQALARPLLFTQELAVVLFVWSVFLGASVAARRQAHFVIDFLPQSMPRWVNLALGVIVALLSLVFAYVLVRYGIFMAETGLRRLSPMSGFQLIWAYISIPVAGVSIAIYTIEHLL
jgi:TRAP-type C4-dicarboxylate transport system permease small subunit